MIESRETHYLRQALALDPQDDAVAVLRLRRQFFEPDVIMAQAADDDGSDLRTRMQHRLNEVRRDFWTLDIDRLRQKLVAIQQIANPETAAAAARLQVVAAARDEIQRLRTNHLSDDRFVGILMQVLVAPPAEANRLREREYRWMRPPAENVVYRTARQAIQGTAHLIRRDCPALFALEEPWLREILEYDPVKESKNENLDALLGIVVLLAIPLVIYIIYKIVTWIF